MNNKTKPSSFSNPFVGARPYRVEDSVLYQGRDQESVEMAHAVKDCRINILTGGSACGKTSFIQAKLIPLFCELRGKHGQQMPIPIILTGWGEGLSGQEHESASFNFQKIILKKLTSWGQSKNNTICPEAFKHLDPNQKLLNSAFYENRFIQDDFKAIQKVFSGYNPNSSTNSITDLLIILDQFCSTRKTKILLIFDQLEEVFRSKDEADDSVIDCLNQLYHRRKDFYFLLSLRQEYTFALRPLEMVAGIPINNQIKKLSNIANSPEPVIGSTSALDIFTKIWKRHGFNTIKKENVNRVLIHCTSTSTKESTDTVIPQKKTANLLLMQAVCNELWDFLHKDNGSSESSTPSFNDKTIDEFEREIAGDRKNIENIVYHTALERWLERKINVINKNHPNIFSKWCTARVARYLVVSDYKVAIPVNMISDRLFTDVSMLPIEKHNNKIRCKKTYSTVESNELRLIPDGISNIEVATIIEKTLEALGTQEVGILKYFANKKVVELVHDQLGPCIDGWSAKYQNSWDDCLGSPLIKQGVEIQPFTGKPVKALKPIRLVFKGCVFIAINNRPPVIKFGEISSSPKHGEFVTFEGITFLECSFNGSLFFYCNFKNCIFKNSDLAGVLFWGCTFTNTTFHNINKNDSQMKFKGCRFNRIKFEGCTIVQASFYEDIDRGFKNILQNPLIITDSSFELCLIEEMQPEENAIGDIAKQKIFGPMENRRDHVFTQCKVGHRIYQEIKKYALGKQNLPIDTKEGS